MTQAARSGWRRRLRAGIRGLRSESGSAALEVGLVAAIFLPPMLVGTAETATVIYASIEVANAAHAATLYGMASSTDAADTTGMTTAAQTEATDFGSRLTVTPTTYYACAEALNGTQYTTQSAATSACTGSGNHALEFVQAKVSLSLNPPFHFAGIPTNYALTSTSVMEVEE